MKFYPRRTFLKGIAATPVLATFGCAHWAEKTPVSDHRPGRLSIIQGPTSSTQSLINVLAPRLKKYSYQIHSVDGKQTVEPYECVTSPTLFKVDKLHIENLKLGTEYTLKVVDIFRGKETVVDERRFFALDTRQAAANFALLSCVSDDARFEAVIDPIWERLRLENPDFIILNGDAVYVDAFDFVERQKATEFDLWQRYVDTFRRIPLYHWTTLKPIFATWDDHDFGTNDGDRTFQSKAAVLRLYRAVFGGKELPGTWHQGPLGVTSELVLAGQRFLFMDDRTFRQPNKDQKQHELYGHWGQEQHDWLISRIASSKDPAWIINGDQFFNGQNLDFKEVFEANHPDHFKKFLGQLKDVAAPVVFGSGDIHFSEIMRIPQERLGYGTFELTSSAMHSFVGDGWENPLRVKGLMTREFNFLKIHSRASHGGLAIDVESMGLRRDPYFRATLQVHRA